MNRTGIEWCQYTWNPVVGCNNGCSYCYARRVAKRTGAITGCQDCADFRPHFHPERLADVTPRQKPRVIFAGSMCDFWSNGVAASWWYQVSDVIEATPQHCYIVLTKQPQRVDDIWLGIENLWIGLSATGCEWEDDYRYVFTMENWPPTGRMVVSWEPAWEIPPLNRGLPDWFIIGAQSGRNRRLPGREAVEEAVRFCGVHNVPVFCKDSIRKLWPDREWPREFPAGIMEVKR